MKLTAALLCDFASARGNLLTVVGAGINQVFRPQYPAPLGISVALAVQFDEDDFGKQHTLRMLVRGPDRALIAAIDGSFGADRPPGTETLAGLQTVVPVVIPLGAVALREVGLHGFEIRVDRGRATTLTLWAREGSPAADETGSEVTASR